MRIDLPYGREKNDFMASGKVKVPGLPVGPRRFHEFRLGLFYFYVAKIKVLH